MKKNCLNILLFSFLSMFILLLILILVVDVQTSVLNFERVGLYSINKLFIVETTEYEMWDILSDVFMYAAILGVLVIAGFGAYQLIKNKSLKKVDDKILVLGAFIILLAVLWILFDKFIVVNYRPRLIDGELEGSFPSTHVMLVSFVFLALGQFFNFENKPKTLKYSYYIVSSLIILFTAIGRIMSLMHWFTDVLGGVLLGVTLFFTYLKALEVIENKKKHN